MPDRGFGPGIGGGGPGAGGPGEAAADAGLVSWLQDHRGGATYLVAAFGSQSSAPIIIVTGEPVMTIGGFTGGDPAPTLAQFEKLVASGQVRYVLVGGGGFGAPSGGPGPGGGASTTSSIRTWVTSHGTQVAASAYGGSTASGTLYDVSGAS